MNIQPNTASGHDSRSGPSNAALSTSSRNLQTKTPQNNRQKVKMDHKIPQPRTSKERNTLHEVSSINDLMECMKLSNNSPCANLDDQNHSEEVDYRNPKRKNAKKKNRNNLHLATGLDGTNQTVPIPIASGSSGSVHNIFGSNNGGQYTSTSPRYLENLQHHPQFQYMQSVQNAIQFQQAMQSMAMQNSQHAASAPTTPLVQMQQRSGTTSIPSSPLTPQIKNMRFIQNMMQHPLLNQTFNTNCNGLVQNAQTPKSKNSPKHQKNNTTDNSEDRRFEKYWTAEDVEEGLKNETLFEGVVRINPKQYQHGFITIDRNEQDIFIDGIKNRNRALEGDIVVVQLIDDNEPEVPKQVKTKIEKSEQASSEREKAEKATGEPEYPEKGKFAPDIDKDKKQKRGKVVYIKEKVHKRTCIGSLKLMPDKSRQKALFVPRDNRIPRLNIPFTCWPDNFYQDAKSYENVLFLAKVMEWYDTRFAIGSILCNIGQAGDMKTETMAILAQNDLDITPFGPEVRHLFPRLDYTIPQEEINLREDCRKLCIYSIDPFNCRDIDDAVSCRKLENGNYEVGVHISDVAHYLTENTVLDEKVADKATTIYLVERAYHMLPDELCMLCSLFPGVDKLAFSVFWEITEDAQVLNHRFAKTVITSCAQLAYEHAQSILEDSDDAKSSFPETYNGYQFEDVQKSLKILGNMAKIFRKNRFDGGALRIDQPKAYFHLNVSDGLPDKCHIYELKWSHQMIEEFMLLANMTVARRLYEDYPNLAFLRCHPRPSGFMLQRLANSLKPLGIDLNISSAGDLHRSMLKYTECADKGKAMVLNMLCAKPMTRAKYFCASGCDDDDFLHYALNVPFYTHFTSPIRRYADIMVHRLLAASLKYREVPKWDPEHVSKVAAQCNKQKYNAKKAGEMSSELYMMKFIEMQAPYETEAVVVEVRERYIDVIIIAFGLNRRIFFNSDFPGEFTCIKNEDHGRLTKMEIKWETAENEPECKQVIEIFTTLTVQIFKSDDAIKIETKLKAPNQE